MRNFKSTLSNYIHIAKKGLLFLFPWRDALAITIGGTPCRFGELWSLVIGLSFIKEGRLRLNKREIGIPLMLVINLFVTVFGITVYRDNIDISFAIKYMVRNIVYLFTCVGFLATRITFDEDNIDKLMKYMICLQLSFFISLNVFGYWIHLGKIVGWNLLNITHQYFTIADHKIPRFMGTTAEAGYLSPLLIMPVYYFISSYLRNKNEGFIAECKKSRNYLIICILLTLFTFSVTVYLFVFGIVFFVSIKNIRKKRINRMIIFLILWCSIAVIAIIGTPDWRELYINQFVNKIRVYFGNTDVSNWSAMDRSQHLRNSWNMFVESSPLQFLFGHGTGAYSLRSTRMNGEGRLLMNAEEAYNLYLSTLTDRGLVGFLCVVMISFYCRKYVTKSIYSKTILAGIIGQFVHWMLVGNFWLYYFWYEIILLIGIYRHERTVAKLGGVLKCSAVV